MFCGTVAVRVYVVTVQFAILRPVLMHGLILTRLVCILICVQNNLKFVCPVPLID